VGRVSRAGEVLLDGPEIHGVPDDVAVVVQLEALDVHRSFEPVTGPLPAEPRQDLPATLQHRRPQRRGRAARVRSHPPPRPALPGVDAGEQGADAAQLAGEPRLGLPGLEPAHPRRPYRHASQRRGLRLRRRGGRGRLMPGERGRPGDGVRAGTVAPRVRRRNGGLGVEGVAAEAAPGAVVRVRVVDLVTAGEHGGCHRQRSQRDTASLRVLYRVRSGATRPGCLLAWAGDEEELEEWGRL
jgi:hypothetical protein